MTPEEKLFRTVVSGGGQGSGSAPEEDDFLETGPGGSWWEKFLKKCQDLTQVVVRYTGRLPVLFGKVSKETLSPEWREQLKKLLSFESLNKGMIGVVALLAVYLALDLLILQPQKAGQIRKGEVIKAGRGILLVPPFPVGRVKPLESYTEAVKNRNIFFPLQKEASQGEAQQILEAQAPVEYKLVGISWDDDGYVAMIEMTNEDRVWFVRDGEQLPGGAKVEKVQEYSVTMSLGQQQWELS